MTMIRGSVVVVRGAGDLATGCIVRLARAGFRVVGLGQGFTAGRDVHAVVETNRGHDLGRVILQGAAEASTSVPGVIAGHDSAHMVRGLIRPGFEAFAGQKVADVDPRSVREHCFSISDKSRAIAGGVLEAILTLSN